MQNSLTAAPSTAGWQWPFSVSTQSRDWVYACDAGPGKPTASSAMTSIWCYAVACGKTSLPCLTFSNSFTWGCLIPLRYSCSYFVILLYFLRTPLLLSPCELGSDEGSYTHSYSFPMEYRILYDTFWWRGTVQHFSSWRNRESTLMFLGALLSFSALIWLYCITSALHSQLLFSLTDNTIFRLGQ